MTTSDINWPQTHQSNLFYHSPEPPPTPGPTLDLRTQLLSSDPSKTLCLLTPQPYLLLCSLTYYADNKSERHGGLKTQRPREGQVPGSVRPRRV